MERRQQCDDKMVGLKTTDSLNPDPMESYSALGLWIYEGILSL